MSEQIIYIGSDDGAALLEELKGTGTVVEVTTSNHPLFKGEIVTFFGGIRIVRLIVDVDGNFIRTTDGKRVAQWKRERQGRRS